MPKVIVPCKACGKEMKLPISSVKETGNYCRKCIGKSPERIALLKRNNQSPENREAARLRMIELNKDNPLNPRWVAGHKAGIVKRESNPDNIKARKDGYKIRSANPEWKENLKKAAVIRNQSTDFVQMKTEQNQALAKDPAWKEAVLNGCAEREKDPLYRKKVSAGLQGIPLSEWTCFTHFLPYCEKFNNNFRERVRKFQGNKCALCGHVWQEGEVALSVHHVHNQKDSCCAEDAPTIFVCLCSRGCHHKTIRHWRRYVGRFTRYLVKNFNGKCYFTKEEMTISMANQERLKKQSLLIAKARRAEPGDLHPNRNVHMHCKECGKPIIVKQKNLNPDGNWCRKHRSNIPGWTEKLKIAAQKRIKNPEWLNGQIKRNQDNGKKHEIRKKISCTKQGCDPSEWKGFVSNEPYCEKFDESLRERNREFFERICVLCGKPESEHIVGPKKIKLDVHHVYLEKKACCETQIEEMEQIRARFPKGIARFGEPQFSEEEIKYIRMMVPLCHGCHGKLQIEKHETPYETTIYRKFFTELILSKPGKCYYTKEEMEVIRQKEAMVLNTYAVNKLSCEVK